MTDPVPYLTPTEVRSRISVGGPTLDADTFDDEWVAEQVEVFEGLLEEHTGDAYVTREGSWVGSVTSCTRVLVLPNVNITDLTSVTVDGDAVTVDEHQPNLAAGMVAYSGGFHPGRTYAVSYEYGHEDTPAVVKQACAMYVEQMAMLDRASSTPDASRVFNDMGGSTVYVQPDPTATPPRLTGYREIDRRINTLRRYKIPGIA